MHDELFLTGSLESLQRLGQLPDRPLPALNLAGREGVPAAEVLARPTPPPEINPPTFSLPDLSLPQLTPNGLEHAGIALHPPFNPDPLLPDLLDSMQPPGVTIITGWPMTTDPSLALWYDQPPERTVTQTILEPDPLIPDLQQPELTPQTTMQQRPGDLDASALALLQHDPAYQQLAQKSYPAILMDQSGSNATRSRHLELLLYGLTGTEGAGHGGPDNFS